MKRNCFFRSCIIRRLKKFFFTVIFNIVAAAFFAVSAYPSARTALPLRCDAPQWLQKSVEGSMSAVWRELQKARMSSQSALEAFALVGSRLFPGYNVEVSARRMVELRPEKNWRWNVRLVFPESCDMLSEPFRSWLTADVNNNFQALSELVKDVPPEALRWSSESFQNAVNDVIGKNIAGWRCSVRVLLLEDESSAYEAVLEVKFYPQPPILLAIAPETLSLSIPQLLADRINMQTLEYLSPLTGLPIEWVHSHIEEIKTWLGAQQLQNSWLRTLKATADNDISLKPIAKVKTQIESSTYSLRGWVSVHIGTEAQLESGLHWGHYLLLDGRIPAELYGELILGLEDWKLDQRLGLRFSPLKPLWLGIELSSEDKGHFWWRLEHETDFRAYGWLRYSDDEVFQGAVGYHLNRYVSLELYYDDDRDDRFSVRALSNL